MAMAIVEAVAAMANAMANSVAGVLRRLLVGRKDDTVAVIQAGLCSVMEST